MAALIFTLGGKPLGLERGSRSSAMIGQNNLVCISDGHDRGFDMQVPPNNILEMRRQQAGIFPLAMILSVRSHV